jgi:hypothetical protein
MTHIKQHILLILILLIISCDNQLKDKNSKNQRIKNLFLKYDEWRQKEIDAQHFVDRCVAMDSIETLTTRYALPKIADLDTNFYDTKEIDTSSFIYNSDTIPDYLFIILPRDCQQGNGIFSQHPPIYILMLSDKDSFVIDNSILKSVESALNNYFGTLKGFYAERLYFEKVFKENGEHVITGTFNIWVEDDATCCPSIDAKFKAFLPSNSSGYIDVEGTIKNEETEQKFEKRLVITK